MDTIKYCINKAKEIPYQKNKYRHYCCITDKKGRVIAEAANNYKKSSPVMYHACKKVGLEFKYYCHAEMLALVRAKGKGYELTVVRINKNNKPVNSKPCPICEYLIKQNKQIKSVKYSI